MKYKVKHIKFFSDGSSDFYFKNNTFYSDSHSINRTDFKNYKKFSRFISKNTVKTNNYLVFLKNNKREKGCIIN